jgi:hypothetical protein
MDWKEDSSNNINNRSTNIVNNSRKSLSNNNIKNRVSTINNIVNKQLVNEKSNDNRSIDIEDSASKDSNSCSTRLSVNNKNEFDNSAIFSTRGSKKSKLEQQHVKESLNNDDE